MLKVMTRVPLQSSVLASALYLLEQRLLEIEFCSGLFYQYLHVPPQNYEELLAAKSKGTYFNSHIRNHFVSRQIDTALGTGSAAI
jgi:hypothetical protein